MKYFLSFLATILLTFSARSQVSITDIRGCNSYTLTATVTGTTPTDIGLYSDDSYSGILSIGFPFQFYGATNTQFIVGENGSLCFNLGLAGGYDPWPISAPLLGNPSVRNTICGPWCDINGLVAMQPIYYSLQGTMPNRTMAVTWCGVYMFSCTTQWTTTQIILYESTNVIEVHVAHKTICAGWNGGYAIIGVQNATGTNATAAPGRDYPSVYNCTNESWRFTPIAGPSYSVTATPYAPIPYSASTIYWYDSTTHAYLGTGPSLIVSPTIPTTYEAVALGCNDSSKAFIHLLPPGCLHAVNNNPCVGDTLFLNAIGDSTGATYLWSGPAGFTSTSKKLFIFPTTSANAGLYRVLQYVGGVPLHSDSTWVTIHPLPVITLTSNIPYCNPVINPLNLFSSLDSFGETFSWTGPYGFTSTLQNPSVNPFDSSLGGTYVATGTSIWGCKNTSSITIVPGITPGFKFNMHYGCNFDTVYFNDISYNATTYKWSFGDATADVLTRNTSHIYNAHDTFTVTLQLSNATCAASISERVDLRHGIHAGFNPTPDTICLDAGAIVPFADLSYAWDSSFASVPPTTWAWNFGDGGTTNYNVPTPTSHPYVSAGRYPVKLIVTDAMGCPDSQSTFVYVVQLHVTSFHDTTLCLSQPLELTNDVSSTPPGFAPGPNTNYSWTQSSPNLDNASTRNPFVSGFGTFTDVLTITVPGIAPDACPVTDEVIINSVQGAPVRNLTVSQTIMYGNSIQLFATGEVLYYWTPNDGSLDNNNINNPIAKPTHTTTYTVFGLDVNGCLDSNYVTVYVDTTVLDGVPSGFTPNNDGLNDVFKPVGIKFQHMVDMRIFNRWGQELFYTNSNENGWDGTYHGIPQDMGTYYYMITIARPGGDNKIYKGSFDLIR